MTKTNFRVTAETYIQARPEQVWTLLTDPHTLTNQTGILSLTGTPARGARLRLISEVSPKRAFKLRVSVFNPNQSMVWTGGMPFGLFTGRRSFTLERLAEGGTRLAIEEAFSGPMAPMIWKSMPDLGPSFEKFTQSIKQQAEGCSA